MNLLQPDKFNGHTLESSSSNDSNNSLPINKNKLIVDMKQQHQLLEQQNSGGSSGGGGGNNGGELFLLYRHLKNRKIYHGVNTKNSAHKKIKGLKIPQEFQGKLFKFPNRRITFFLHNILI